MPQLLIHQLIRISQKLILPVMPLHKRLPFSYWLYTLSGSCEKELLYLEKITPYRNVAIDIGANIGFYSYKMAQLFSEVYAFEVNNDLTHQLAAFNPGNIHIINKGISSNAGDAKLFIPVLRNIPLTGWASLTPGNCPDTNQHIEKPVQICTLDSFDIKSVSFIKIDVEGHEIEVLKGA